MNKRPIAILIGFILLVSVKNYWQKNYNSFSEANSETERSLIPCEELIGTWEEVTGRFNNGSLTKHLLRSEKFEANGNYKYMPSYELSKIADSLTYNNWWMLRIDKDEIFSKKCDTIYDFKLGRKTNYLLIRQIDSIFMAISYGDSLVNEGYVVFKKHQK